MGQRRNRVKWSMQVVQVSDSKVTSEKDFNCLCAEQWPVFVV